MSKNTKDHYSRHFLNKNRGTAFIESTATNSDDYSWNDIFVALSDCHRQIQLDFSFSSENGRQERLDKIDLIIKEFKEVRKIVKTLKFEKRKSRKSRTINLDELAPVDISIAEEELDK